MKIYNTIHNNIDYYRYNLLYFIMILFPQHYSVVAAMGLALAAGGVLRKAEEAGAGESVSIIGKISILSALMYYVYDESRDKDNSLG